MNDKRKTLLEITKDGFVLDSKPFYLASGDIHYFRFFKDGWRRRLQIMKDFGLTAIQTYVPWNLHEPEEGEFCFEGNLNLAEFLKLCDEVGLKVMFRPSVYMCSEWDLGGLPYWLLNKNGMAIRTSDPEFMKIVRRYYERLAREFIPYLSTNGGPIIAVAVENEYGSFSDDREYLKQTGDLLRELGVDVPFYTGNGFEKKKMQDGSLPEYWTTLDVHELTEEAEKNLKEYQPDKPIYIAEFWGGRSQQWGGFFKRQKAEDVAELYKGILEKGAYVNFYMFCGGTNFGFQNGALVGRYGADVPDAPNRYIPFATSYDVDALVTEYGEPTEKYYACKKILREQMEKRGFEFMGTDDDCLINPVKTQIIDKIKLEKSADLLENVTNISHKICKAGFPHTFEDMGQAYGFMLYSTWVNYTDDKVRSITIDGLRDRALIYADGKYIGGYMRDRKNEPVKFTVPKEGIKIDILVENMGRVNYGNRLPDEYKGISGFVKLDVFEEDGSLNPWDYSRKSGWTNVSLPIKSEDLEKIDWSKTAKDQRPAFFSGEFDAVPGVDTFINPNGWEKGCIFINGFNIGRYWSVGPQGTLYIPGELLKEKNTIHILELHSPKSDLTIKCDDKPSLDTIKECGDLVVSVVG